MKKCLFVCLVLAISGCSTHKLPVDYIGSPSKIWSDNKTNDSVSINFLGASDKRGEGVDWLGAIRGGYGNVLKSLRTEKPVSEVVTDVFRQAILARGLHQDLKSPYVNLHVDILKFDCSYYFNKEAHAHLMLKLVDPTTGGILYSDTTKVDDRKSGFGAGIFGSVEGLKLFAEQTLANAVDQSLDKPDFLKAIKSANQKTNLSHKANTRERLLRLKALFDEEVISEEEYRLKRAEVLGEL